MESTTVDILKCFCSFFCCDASLGIINARVTYSQIFDNSVRSKNYRVVAMPFVEYHINYNYVQVNDTQNERATERGRGRLLNAHVRGCVCAFVHIIMSIIYRSYRYFSQECSLQIIIFEKLKNHRQ